MEKHKKSHKIIYQHQPVFSSSDAKAIHNVIKSGWVSEGPHTKKFEENYRKFVGTKYAIATSSGTAAIFLGLMGVGIKPGDEVLVPNLTFIATASAVKLAGATPILIEINSKDFTIDCNSVKKKITKKTKAVVPVHLNGRTTNLDELLEIGQKHQLRIIEDASQALGSRYKKQYLGSIGDVSAFSLAPTKIITTGQGGMITTNNSKIYNLIKKIKDQGRRNKSENYSMIGYNFKFTDIHAALGNSQFSKLKERLTYMKSLFKIYSDLLKINTKLLIPETSMETQLWYFDVLCSKRPSIIKYLLKNNITARPFHKPINKTQPYKTKEKFMVSSSVSKMGLYLPSHMNLSHGDVEKICNIINKI